MEIQKNKNQSIKESFVRRHKTIIVFGISTLILLIAAGIFYLLTPPEAQLPLRSEPVPQPSIPAYSNKTIPVKKVTAQGVSISVPSTMAVYDNLFGVPDMGSLSESVANKLGLTKQGSTLWSSTTQTLTYEQKSTALHITQNNPVPSSKRGFEDNKLIEASANQMTQLGLPVPDKKYLTFEIAYYLASNDLDPADDQSRANVAIVTVKQKINDWRVMFREQTNTFTQLTFDPDYQLINITYVPLLAPKPLFEMKTISFEQALKNIEGGTYTITSAYQQSGVPVTLNKLEHLDFTHGVLEYHYFPDVNKLYPYYRLTGTGYDFDSEFSYSVEVLTPAIETTPTPTQQ